VDLPAPLARRRSSPPRQLVALYREELAFVWRALFRLGVPRADCDDATQDVFVTAHRRWSTLRDGERRRAWLFGIVRRVAWRHRRTRARHDRRVEALGRTPAPGVDHQHELTRREAWRALAAFLDTLDEQKRAVFVLGELEELGRTEIGAALGINANTAYSRLQAARRAFLAHFAGYDDDHVANLLAQATIATEMPPETARRTWAAILLVVGVPTKTTAMTTIAWAAGAIAIASSVTAVAAWPEPDGTAEVASVDPGPLTGLAVPRVEPVTTVEIPRGTVPAPSTEPPSVLAEPRVVERRATRSATRDEPETVDDEVAVLVAARDALRRGELREARRHLDDHRASFGNGAALPDVRAQIERDLAAAQIDPPATGDSIPVEHDP
jgi:RNA polymerase sigma factor (sigma-70 family)